VAETVVVLRDIIVKYGDLTAVQVSALDIYPGKVLALIGPNGAGKSTLLRVLGLLQQPTAGKVYFCGEAVTRKSALGLRRRMASAFQEPLLLNATVYDNAALGLKLRGLSRREIDRRLRPWLERLGIGLLASRPVRTLSGGEAQRTSLARAFVLEPEVLLLDEPFAALDQPSREILLEDLQEILKWTGITTVLVTHDRQEAFMLANRVGVLHMGRLLQLAATDEVFMHPESSQVAEIVGFENRIPGVVESVADDFTTVRFDSITCKIIGQHVVGSRVVLCIRSEDLMVNRCEAGYPSNEWNCLKTKVTSISPGILHHRVTLSCGRTTLHALVDRKKTGDMHLVKGAEAIVSFHPKRMCMIDPSSM
jgi:tungstate transport system ATP-binding protein